MTKQMKLHLAVFKEVYNDLKDESGGHDMFALALSEVLNEAGIVFNPSDFGMGPEETMEETAVRRDKTNKDLVAPQGVGPVIGKLSEKLSTALTKAIAMAERSGWTAQAEYGALVSASKGSDENAAMNALKNSVTALNRYGMVTQAREIEASFS